MTARALLVPTLLALLSGCGILEGKDCTADVRPGIVVTIVEKETGLPVAEGARGVVRDGEFQDSLHAHQFDGESRMISRASAWERRGTYSVVVDHPDYELWVRDRVEVSDDECHVRTIQLTAELGGDAAGGD